ncbi:hypothetical protein M2158_007821 [Streptomyces sp. SAI-144]|nr:hypothetical protein [Streptomyces sp. SAI-144]MDH6486660.1 hypothetical protein [Streptomyces sp. SAI-127]
MVGRSVGGGRGDRPGGVRDVGARAFGAFGAFGRKRRCDRAVGGCVDARVRRSVPVSIIVLVLVSVLVRELCLRTR